MPPLFDDPTTTADSPWRVPAGSTITPNIIDPGTGAPLTVDPKMGADAADYFSAGLRELNEGIGISGIDWDKGISVILYVDKENGIIGLAANPNGLVSN